MDFLFAWNFFGIEFMPKDWSVEMSAKSDEE